ncbi:hypothetical protein MLD38_011055 [Melastoma candidum]|uniref:Uncharacterized protein n=1 Tax=Melastoma candidum TaxID=119954 RepID=A0ACB9R1B2_9MYRT|nr:hypothetical protein MLD38_011055 [Melastoma candidum]
MVDYDSYNIDEIKHGQDGYQMQDDVLLEQDLFAKEELASEALLYDLRPRRSKRKNFTYANVLVRSNVEKEAKRESFTKEDWEVLEFAFNDGLQPR